MCRASPPARLTICQGDGDERLRTTSNYVVASQALWEGELQSLCVLHDIAKRQQELKDIRPKQGVMGGRLTRIILQMAENNILFHGTRSKGHRKNPMISMA